MRGGERWRIVGQGVRPACHQGGFGSLIGADFDGESILDDAGTIIHAEVEAGQANGYGGGPSGDTLGAFDTIFDLIAGGYQVKFFRNAKRHIEARELAPAVRVPTSARADREDVIARVLNDFAFVEQG